MYFIFKPIPFLCGTIGSTKHLYMRWGKTGTGTGTGTGTRGVKPGQGRENKGKTGTGTANRSKTGTVIKIHWRCLLLH